MKNIIHYYVIMDVCIVIQCFNKPSETLEVLKSLEENDNIQIINLLLFIDKANIGTKHCKKNKELIELLQNYKNNKNNAYKSITLKISEKNLGPYKACCECIDNAFQISKFIIFSEDDILFCKDALKYYNSYFNSNIINNEPNCLGITTSSIRFGFKNKTSFKIIENKILINDELQEKIDIIKEKIKSSNLQYTYETVHWAPNKQFGMLKENWDKIRFYRTDEYILNKNLNNTVPDYAVGNFVRENKFYFYYSYIPRSNDIGLYNELGCTTLYYNGIVSPDTIKYLTSNDFNISHGEYKLANDLSLDDHIE